MVTAEVIYVFSFVDYIIFVVISIGIVFVDYELLVKNDYEKTFCRERFKIRVNYFDFVVYFTHSGTN